MASFCRAVTDMVSISTGLRGTAGAGCASSGDNIGGVSLAGRLCQEPIDVVYTWVNGSDPHWLAEMQLYRTLAAGNPITPTNSSSSNSTTTAASPTPGSPGSSTMGSDPASANRYRDNEELRFSMRSLFKYAPWIRRIHLVTNGQVPWWLDTDHPRVQVVTHADIFRNQSHLPVFSSPAIEVHLHRIPGLSRRFVYFNDDVLLGNDVWPEDFRSPGGAQRVYLSWEVPKCQPGCIDSWIGDGFCDRACNHSRCMWDNGDCSGPNVKPGAGMNAAVGRAGMAGAASTFRSGKGMVTAGIPDVTYCAEGCPSNWLGDKTCDTRCERAECAWDAADCGAERIYSTLPGVSPTPDDALVAAQRAARTTEDAHLAALARCESRHNHSTSCDSLPARNHSGSEWDLIPVPLRPVTLVLPDSAVSAYVNLSGVVHGLVDYAREIHACGPLRNGSTCPTHDPTIRWRAAEYTEVDWLPQVILAPYANLLSLLFDATQMPWCETDGRCYAPRAHPNSAAPTPPPPPSSSANNGTGHGNRTSLAPRVGRLALGETVLHLGLSLNQVFFRLTLPVRVERDPLPSITPTVAPSPTTTNTTSIANSTTAGARRLASLEQDEVEEFRRRIQMPPVLGRRDEAPTLVSMARRAAWGRLERSNPETLVRDAWQSLVAAARSAQDDGKPVTPAGGRRLMDTYGDSLVRTNAMISSRFGRRPRKVPAHMPHMIDRQVMEDLQAAFPQAFDETSARRFRSEYDVQYAFAYFYWVMEGGSSGGLNLDRFWQRELDTDGDGVLSENELRTLVAVAKKGSPSDRDLSDYRNCLTTTSSTSESVRLADGTTAQTTVVRTSAMTLQALVQCQMALDGLKKHARFPKTYEDGSIDEVAFEMINDNFNKTRDQLDSVRARRTKFVCINDDMKDAPPRLQKLLRDFFESFFPLPSPLELPAGQRNPSLYVQPLREARQARLVLRVAAAIGILVLAAVAVSTSFTWWVGTHKRSSDQPASPTQVAATDDDASSPGQPTAAAREESAKPPRRRRR